MPGQPRDELRFSSTENSLGAQLLGHFHQNYIDNPRIIQIIISYNFQLDHNF